MPNIQRETYLDADRLQFHCRELLLPHKSLLFCLSKMLNTCCSHCFPTYYCFFVFNTSHSCVSCLIKEVSGVSPLTSVILTLAAEIQVHRLLWLCILSTALSPYIVIHHLTHYNPLQHKQRRPKVHRSKEKTIEKQQRYWVCPDVTNFSTHISYHRKKMKSLGYLFSISTSFTVSDSPHCGQCMCCTAMFCVYST